MIAQLGRMRAAVGAVTVVAAMVLAAGATRAFAADTTPAQSLYKRLGGYDAIAAVVDDFLGRLATDKDLGRYFVGHGKSSHMRTRQLIVDQICAATGGPCYYTGRDMKATHEGMGISKADWDKAVAHLNATFDKFSVGQKERGEVLATLGSFHAAIVEK